ncbi:hypothetical protein [Bacillus benzoevorans]|uniref:Uncharacterized protein n=1 Tax=Bacillus benzoevorans TaxID=1456 RepID=A0A7X0HTK6_9BACI|nr:hypothetical protein [Bacillus benzoevorans]MBB6446617.1 hypothetical protein [Bacillus benzoevorans]
MPEYNNNKEQTKNVESGMDRGEIENNLSNDNAFSDQGLENASKLNHAMKKGNAK